MIDQAALDAATGLLERLRVRELRLTTAESCTGGLIAAALTHIAGSSDVLDRGFVTYSNASKSELLGVPAELIASHGAVSEPVARYMARGALERSLADIAVSVTGVAGPGGGSADKPVGTVWFGVARRSGAEWTERRVFDGDRGAVRLATVRHAFALILQAAA